MADNEFEILTKLAWESDTAKLEESKGLVDQLGVSLDGLAEKATVALGAFVAFSKIWAWFSKGADDALKMEESTAALSSMVRTFGGNVDDAVAKTNALSEKLESIGVNAVQTTDAVRKLTMITGGDYVNALAGAELATRVSIGMHVDFSRALMLVQLAMEGSPRAVNVALRQFGIHAKSANDVLEILYKRTEDINPALGTMAARIRVAEEGFSSFGRTIGVVWDYVKVAVIGAFQYVAAGVEIAIGKVVEFGGSLMNLVKYAVELATKGPEEAAKNYKATQESLEKDFEDVWKDGAARIKGVWDGMAVDAGKAGQKAHTEFVGYMDDAVKAWKKRQEQIAKDEEQASAEHDRKQQEADRAQDAADLKKRQDRLKAVLEYYKMLEDRDSAMTAELAKHEDVRLKQVQDYAAKRLAALKKEDAAAEAIVHRGMADNISAQMKILAADIDTKQRQLKLAQEYGEATGQLSRDLTDLQVTEAQIAADAALGTLSALFPQQKEFRIAEAVIDTIASSVKAFDNAGGYPEGLIPMAISLATGFAKVAAIESTKPGSGSSSGGGGGGAATSISIAKPNVYTGYGSAPSSGSNTQVTTNKPTYNNVTINALDTNNALRTLQTNLRPASRNYDRSIGTRTPTSIGSKRGG